MRRRITKVKSVTFLSLCPRGVNWLPVLYKEAGAENVRFELLTKASEKFDEEGLITALAYVPERRDAEGDIASPEVVREMAHSFAKEGIKLDLRHNEAAVTKDRAFVAETFVVQKGDPRFANWKDYDGKAVDPTGAWGVVIKVEDPVLRKAYREGAWNGVSLGGRAETVVEKEAKIVTKEELEALFAAHGTAMLKAMDEKIGSLKKSELAPAPPALKVDLTNPDEVRKHLATIRKERLAKSIDLGDEAAVEAHLALLEKEAEERLKNETPAQKNERLAKEVAILTLKLSKAQKASSVAPTADLEKGADEEDTGLSKEHGDRMTLGRKIAEQLNKSRGFATK